MNEWIDLENDLTMIPVGICACSCSMHTVHFTHIDPPMLLSCKPSFHADLTLTNNYPFSSFEVFFIFPFEYSPRGELERVNLRGDNL